MEILVVDGRSTDNTRKIAMEYKCTIIENPKIFPAWAKYIGYTTAKGHYAMFLDSDEVIVKNDSLLRKINAFRNNRIRAVTGSGYIQPHNYPFITQYSSEYGEPFSFYYYRLSKDYRYFIPTMKAGYSFINETDDQVVFKFDKDKDHPIFELVAMGSMIDLEYMKSNFRELSVNPGLIPHIINFLINDSSLIAIIKNDPLLHYSSETYGKYLRKIKSRVINNIYTHASEGFKGREKFEKKSKSLKKFLFIPYALSIILPILDSCILSLQRRNISYFIHVPLSLYTGLLILYYYTLRFIGVKPIVTSYGGNEKILSIWR